MNIDIRPPIESDKERWLTLFGAYQTFYRAAIPPDIIETTWKRIHDSSSPVNALVAELDGQLIGITHYLFHDSTWSDRPNCYLEDLYVSKDSRGTNAARLLIDGVEAAATTKNAFRLYWHTQQFNGAARSLYDTITPPSSFIVYRKKL